MLCAVTFSDLLRYKLVFSRLKLFGLASIATTFLQFLAIGITNDPICAPTTRTFDLVVINWFILVISSKP